MHREYRPQEMHQLDADPFAPGQRDMATTNRARFMFSRLYSGC